MWRTQLLAPSLLGCPAGGVRWGAEVSFLAPWSIVAARNRPFVMKPCFVAADSCPCVLSCMGCWKWVAGMPACAQLLKCLLRNMVGLLVLAGINVGPR